MMAAKGRKAAPVFFLVLLTALLWMTGALPVLAAGPDEEYAAEVPELEESLDFSELDDELQELFPEETPDFKETVSAFLSGNLKEAWDLLGRLVSGQLFYAFQVNRESLVHMILLAVAAAVFSNFSAVFQTRQTSEISFYVLYMLMIAVCLHAFQSGAGWIEQGLEMLVSFMKALCPVFFAAVSIARGSMTGAAFYHLTLLIILGVELVLIRLLLPALHIYMMLKVLNDLSREEYLSRMIDLAETVISWTLKTMLAVVAGLNVVQGLITPAVDSVKRSVVARGVEAIPGIGDAVSGTGEVLLGTAAAVKNGIGAAGAVVCIGICLVPLVQTGVLVILYKLAAAVLEPVSDSRMTGCIAGMADACQLLMRLIFTAGMLFLLTIAIVAAASSL